MKLNYRDRVILLAVIAIVVLLGGFFGLIKPKFNDIKENKAFYPSEETFNHLEVYDNLGQKWLGIYNDLYLQFKMYHK